MYDDDLLLVPISVSDLQKLLEICQAEFIKIDMRVNASKSSCIRVGSRFNAYVCLVSIDQKQVVWGRKIKYLGRTILAGKVLHHDFHPVKAKFFGSLNSFLGKVGTNASLNVLLHLTYSKCSPILTYGLEAIKINKSAQDNLSNVHNSIFAKLFKTFDQSILEQCHYYTGYLTFNTALELRRLQFLETLSESLPSPAKYMFSWFGVNELSQLKTRNNIPPHARSSG